MVDIPTLDDLQRILDPLIARNLVVCLPPLPGSRAERYAQLLSPDAHSLDAPPQTALASAPPRGEGVQQRILDLEARVAALEQRLDQMSAQVGGNSQSSSET
jgi:uncharacterized protein YceH (UPF0502 family)